MRVNLTATATHQQYGLQTLPISLTIKPARGLPGEYMYKTDSRSLINLLKRETDLPSSVLERFTTDVRFSPSGRLLGVELSEQVLTDIGYFV